LIASITNASFLFFYVDRLLSKRELIS